MTLAKSYWALPGPRGPAGADGSDGTDGENGYTVTTAGFTMPAEGADVTVPVSSSDWASVGMVVYVEDAGYFEVASLPTSTQMSLTNLEVNADGEYTGNVAPGSAVATAKRVAPGGLQGPAGVDGVSGADPDAYYFVNQATDAPTNAINLGLLSTGLVKITVAAGVATPSVVASTATGESVVTAATAAAARAAITAAASGANSDITSLSALSTPLSLAQGGTAGTSAATARSSLSAAASGANSDITSLSALSTPLSKAQGGTGVAAMPYFSVNLGGSDQAGVVSGASTKIAFDTEISDVGGYFDTSTSRFLPLVAGAYAFTIAVQVNSLAAGGDIVKAHLYKNGALVATGQTVAEATENVQAQLHFISAANGTTDYFEAFVEHDAGVNKDVEGDEEVTFFCGHWIG